VEERKDVAEQTINGQASAGLFTPLGVTF